MKTHIVACAVLLTSSLPTLAQGVQAESPLVPTLAPRIANPPPAPLVGGSDSCLTPDVLTGTGTFAFDTTSATTGTEGQSMTNCNFLGLTAIRNDVWFAWTATQSGTVAIATCGLTTVNTKMAAYNYSGSCPAAGGLALACNDDASAFGPLQAKVVIQVTAGQQVLLQVGLSPGASPGIGQIEIQYISPVSGCTTLDDGTTEYAIRLDPAVPGNPYTTCWMNRYGLPADVTTVTAISSAWGRTNTSSPLPAGLTAFVGLWDDPNDDGDPPDLVLVAQASATMVGQHTNLFQTIALPSPTTVAGVFFIGAWVTHTSGFPAPVDRSTCDVVVGDTWTCGDDAGNFQPANLGANSFPPEVTGSLLTPNVGGGFAWLLRATCSTAGTGMPFCSGDGTGTACPCANHSAVGADEGCLSSLNTGGKLRAHGVPSLAADSLSLHGTQMPNSACLYFQGSTQVGAGAGAQFGDGKRCAGGNVIRLKTKVNAGGASTYPEAGDPRISLQGMISAPGVRSYQAWYRNAAAFCTPSTFNLSNGLEITWHP